MGVKKIIENAIGRKLPKCELLILQPSPFCNLQCNYCYLNDKDNTSRMSEETIRATFENFFSSPFAADTVNVAWHAGEPMALPMSFYEKAFAIIDELNVEGKKIRHNFQTNATTINDKWCEFVKKHHISIGVSMDGPQHIHDFNRVDRRGNGSFLRAMKGVDKLKEHGIPFSMIAVLTQAALHQPKEMFEFFHSAQPMNLGFNPEEQEGIHQSGHSLDQSQLEPLIEFYVEFMKLNQKSGSPMNIRSLSADSMAGYIPESVLRDRSSRGNQENTPFSIITIGAQGDISTFSPELIGQNYAQYNNFVFGNVYSDRLADIIYSPHFVRAYLDIQKGRQRCKRTCPLYFRCRGGAPSEKIGATGKLSGTRTINCSLKHNVQAQAINQFTEREVFPTFLNSLSLENQILRSKKQKETEKDLTC